MKLFEIFYFESENHYIIYQIDKNRERIYPCWAVYTKIPSSFKYKESFKDNNRYDIYEKEIWKWK